MNVTVENLVFWIKQGSEHVNNLEINHQELGPLIKVNTISQVEQFIKEWPESLLKKEEDK